MPAAFMHLLIRSWFAMTVATNSNTLGILLWGIGFAFVTWVAAVLHEWKSIGSQPRRIRIAVGKSRPVAVSGTAVVCLVALVWAIFAIRTVYYERTGMRWAYTREVHRNQELLSQIHLRNRGITSDDPAYMELIQILGQFQSYGSVMRGKPCTIVFTSEPDSFRITQAIAQASALVSHCNTFGPDAPELPNSISNKEEGMVPGVIVVHSGRQNHAAISFQRGLGTLLPTRYSYTPPKKPSFSTNGKVMWLQFGAGAGWKK